MTCSVCLIGRHVGCRGCDCRICVSPNGDIPKRVTERRPKQSLSSPKMRVSRPLVLLPSPEIDLADQRLTGREWRWALTPAQIRTSQIMKQNGATWAEVAAAFGLPASTVHATLTHDNPRRDFAVWYAKSLPLAATA